MMRKICGLELFNVSERMGEAKERGLRTPCSELMDRKELDITCYCFMNIRSEYIMVLMMLAKQYMDLKAPAVPD